MKRLAGLAVASAVAATMLAPQTAAAGPRDNDGSAWGAGSVMPGLGFGASFGSDIHVISLAASASYFVINGLGVGLSFNNTWFIYRDNFKRDFPGIENESPSYEAAVIPSLQYVFLRQKRFSPFIRAGVGPVFYNRNRGTVGEWVTGAGAFIRVAGPVSIAVGVDFFANFPDADWQEAFSYQGQSIRGCALIDNPCSFNVSPRIGLVFSIPTKRKRKKKEQPPPEPVPMENPMFEAEPEPAPVEPEPVEPPPEEPPVEPAAEEPPVSDAPPAGDEPAADTPPADDVAPPESDAPADAPPQPDAPADAPAADAPAAEPGATDPPASVDAPPSP